jgi:DNA uptake protein ComE-like DNA-binding protein
MLTTTRLSRRSFTTGALAGATSLALIPRLAFAQSDNASTTPTTSPEGAALWLRYNLNFAGDDQFLSIPDVGDRMLDEFNEYKPYTSILQFREEIGKYVDESQVAAYERYLFVSVDPASADAATIAQIPGVTTEIADQLAASVPYADDAAFLSAVASVIPADFATAAGQFLTSTATPTAGVPKFNLNIASDDQFLMVPGVGDRMLDEFNEYKPYASILQFREEIGKYVDASEVAAYEAYVFVPVSISSADKETLMQIPGVSADDADTLLARFPFADQNAFNSALAALVSSEQLATVGPWLTA